ncbi:hypothetical protein MBLNU459_g5959t1 [Dothideomycetes sp. NU459]
MSLESLTQSINTILDTQKSFDDHNEEERKLALRACEDLKARLETPFEKTLHILFSTYQAMALRLAVDMKIFDAVSSMDKEPRQISLAELAAKTNVDELFHEAFPTLTDLPSEIKAMGYNFFDEQPVKGARAYFLRTVLHDWPDKQALQILSKVREAMNAESLLLINETILPEREVALSSAQADLTMMVSFASLERTRKQFAALLDEAGFELMHVWTPSGLEGSSAALAEQAILIEAKLK